MASYLGRRSAWGGSLAIMRTQSPSLSYQWLIHQTFIFCPLSTVSLCLSLPSPGWKLKKHGRWERIFFSPNFCSPSPQIFFISQISYLRLGTLPQTCPPTPIFLATWRLGWLATFTLNFLLNDVMIRAMIKHWIVWGVFPPLIHDRAEKDKKEEICKINDSTSPN